MRNVRVYGTEWCEDTRATRYHLDSLGVQYDYIDIEREPGALEWVRERNAGKRKTPTLDVDGEILVEPDERVLEEHLRGKGLMG